MAFRVALLSIIALFVVAEGKPRIHFNDTTGELKILVFSDLHYGETEDRDNKSDIFQKTLLDVEKPDMVSGNAGVDWLNPISRDHLLVRSLDLRVPLKVVFNGDAYSDYGDVLCWIKFNCTEFFVKQWERFTAIVRKRQIPYAFALGNHDHFLDGIKPDGKSIMTYDATHSNLSLAKEAPPGVSGGSVYYVPVYENSTAQGKPTGVLWMLDSGKLSCMGLTGWGCATEDQIEWFKSQAESEDLRGLQGLMFVHIPLQEVLLYWNVFGKDPQRVSGEKDEDVGCSSGNTGLFTAALGLNVSGIFHGHDHNNDFLARVESTSRTIHVGYGRKSGYGGYGGVLAAKPGARVIIMKLNRDRQDYTWSTYIRLENNSTAHETVDQSPQASQSSNVQGFCHRMA
ncbi:purple acid phosphatase [Perkinsus olseni]|uniref:Purple acid phosphatase n=1 Tax=Perkinsus olseni TaxID=32597 RepID=A0A7J6RJK4_PEROL|nr:purple acid phosphatase [Perkinsus olseni]